MSEAVDPLPHDSIDASNVKFVRVGGTVKVKGELVQLEREDGTLEFVSLDPPVSPKSYADVGSEGNVYYRCQNINLFGCRYCP